MRYTELTIKTERDHFEELQALLIEAGFTAMQIDDPLDAADIAAHPELYKYDYINEEIVQKAAGAQSSEAEGGGEKSREDRVTVTLYFNDDEEGAADLRRAERLLEDFRSGIAEAEAADALCFGTAVTGDDSEWLYKWQEHFKPTKIGSRIVVRPGWEEYRPAEGELVIEMDPGMAFGSGLHETTSMCIKALEKYMAPGANVLDVGTGTGILAMAAVLLGADRALGIDIDEEAVRVSGENIAKNGLQERIRIEKGNLMDGVDCDADIIVANLMADLVMMLSPAAGSQLRPGGLYITSGILDIKEEVVAETIRGCGFGIKEILSDGEWRAIVAVRK